MGTKSMLLDAPAIYQGLIGKYFGQNPGYSSTKNCQEEEVESKTVNLH
jgi:hypothetical protein